MLSVGHLMSQDLEACRLICDFDSEPHFVVWLGVCVWARLSLGTVCFSLLVVRCPSGWRASVSVQLSDYEACDVFLGALVWGRGFVSAQLCDDWQNWWWWFEGLSLLVLKADCQYGIRWDIFLINETALRFFYSWKMRRRMVRHAKRKMVISVWNRHKHI